MAVSAKSRRKLVVDGRKYLWYVKEDDDSVDHILYVLSDDKRFIVRYRLAQPHEKSYVTVLGKEFYRVAGTGGTWRRFRCPRWDSENGSITPDSVRRLIEWCMVSSEETTEVDWTGHVVPLGGLCKSCGVDVRGMLSPSSGSCHKCGHPIPGRFVCAT